MDIMATQHSTDTLTMNSQDVERADEGPNDSKLQPCQGAKPRPDPPAEPVEADIKGLPLLLMSLPLILALLQTSLNSTIVSTIIPAITAEFNSVDDVGWYASAFLFPMCAMAPLTGKLFSLFNLRWTLVVFIAIFLLGALLGGLANTSPMFITARAIAGIGSSGIFTGCLAIAAVAVPLARRASLVGSFLGVYAVGQAAGPIIGGTLVSKSTWRWCFYLNIPIGAFAIALVSFAIKIPGKPTPAQQTTVRQKLAELDFQGWFGFALAIVLLLFGLQRGGTKDAWSSSVVVGTLSGGFVTLALVACWFYYKGNDALVPVRFFQGWTKNAIGLTSFMQSGGVILTLYWLPFWFQAIKEMSAFRSGVALLPLLLFQMLFSVVGGRMTKMTGYYLPAVIAGNVLIIIGSGLMTTFSPSTSTGQWVGYQVVCGAGRGFVMQVLVMAMQAQVPAEDASMASAYVMFYQFFGGAVFTSVAKTVLTSTLSPALDEYAPDVGLADLLNTGVTEIRQAVPIDQLGGVQLAYNKAITNVFYLQLATACCALVAGMGTGWKSLKQVDQERAAQAGGEQESGLVSTKGQSSEEQSEKAPATALVSARSS